MIPDTESWTNIRRFRPAYRGRYQCRDRPRVRRRLDRGHLHVHGTPTALTVGESGLRAQGVRSSTLRSPVPEPPRKPAEPHAQGRPGRVQLNQLGR